MDETIRIIGIGRQISIVGIAVGEMAEGREDVVAVVTPHGADDLAGIARPRVEAFHQREIAVRCRAQQCLEIGAGVRGNAHIRSPLLESVSASQPSV